MAVFFKEQEGDPDVDHVDLASSKETDKNVQRVFLGCPGVGEGTYASRLSTLLGVPHIAIGDLVRDELCSSDSKAAPFSWIDHLNLNRR